MSYEGAAVTGDGYTIELFVFPDGTRVEMIVFEPRMRAGGSATSAAPTTPAAPAAPAASSTPASAPACTSAAPLTTPPPCCAPQPRSEDAGVHSCPVCGSKLVYPVEWERCGASVWTLELRCPECETRREVTLNRASIEQLHREAYRGTQAIAREAQRQSRRNFEDEVERIIAALERDLIQPIDF